MSERVVFENKRGQELVGILHKAGENAPGIVMVHGFTGDKDEHGLFVNIAQALKEEGFTVLRFDCAGSGESEGEFKNMTRRTEADDLRAAIEFIKKQDIDKDRICVIGLSLGAAASVLAYRPKIKTMVLLSAALGDDILWNRYKDNEKYMRELEEKGYFTRRKDSGTYRVGEELLKEAGKIDFKKRAGEIEVPVLMIHGSEDGTVDVENPQKVVDWFLDARLEIIEGSGHNYREQEYESEVIKKISKWFNKHL